MANKAGFFCLTLTTLIATSEESQLESWLAAKNGGPTAGAADLAQLREQGVLVLRGAFPKDALLRLKRSAEACFSAIEAGQTQSLAAVHQFTPFSYSVLLAALSNFGGGSIEDLMAPLQAAGLDGLLAEAIRGDLTCNLEQAWVRKRYAPINAPRQYHPNTWHQDGGLDAVYSPEPDSAIPLTRLLTCWIPLHPCGVDCPGLEFIRHRLDVLIHYSELEDLRLRQRFASELFWAPVLESGDGVLFLAGSLHRTYVQQEMRRDRLSVEYRFFPGSPKRKLLR